MKNSFTKKMYDILKLYPDSISIHQPSSEDPIEILTTEYIPELEALIKDDAEYISDKGDMFEIHTGSPEDKIQDAEQFFLDLQRYQDIDRTHRKDTSTVSF